MTLKLWKEITFWVNLFRARKTWDEESLKALLDFQPNDVY